MAAKASVSETETETKKETESVGPFLFDFLGQNVVPFLIPIASIQRSWLRKALKSCDEAPG